MSENQKHGSSCFYCNHTMNTDLDAFVVVSVGGRSGGRVQDMNSMDEKFIETLEAKLCSCPQCGKRERIVSEDVVWLSMREMLTAVRQGRILSNNPEIELIFKILERLVHQTDF